MKNRFREPATRVPREGVQNEGFVISSPMIVSQTNEHVERTTRSFHLKTFNALDAVEAMSSAG